MFAFPARAALLLLRLTPKDWTAVTLQFSPALPLGESEDNDADGTADMTRQPSSLPGPQPQGTHVEDVLQVAPAVPNLRAIVHERCPSLVDPDNPDHYYSPTPYLASGHLQTIYSSFRKTVLVDPVRYRRRVVLTPDGGTLSIDVAPPRLAGGDEDDETPTLVVVTGLTGGSAETYVRHVVRPAVEEKKWRAVVINYRGCAHTPATSMQLYSASKTSDLATAILFCQQNWPRSPLVAVGFSLGANVLGKYLGESGDATPLRGALTVAGPYDLTAGSHCLESGGMNKHVYSKTMCKNLTRVFMRQADILSLSPKAKAQLDRLTEDPAVVKQQVQERGDAVPYSLFWFDDNVTRVLGGYHKPYGEFPFADAWAYYRGGSAAHVLHRVSRPMLAIHSHDDPVVPYRCAEAVAVAMGTREPHSTDAWDEHDPSRPVPPTVLGQGNPNLLLASVQYGGHLGWWTGAQPSRWFKTPALEWLSALIEAPEFADLPLPPNPHVSGGTQVTPVKADVFPYTMLRPYIPAAHHRAQSSQASGSDADQADQAVVNENTQTQAPERPTPTHANEASSERVVGNDRIAFLTTPVLGETELLHPFAHEWYQDATSGVARREAASAQGVLGLPLTMVQDKARLAVGYAELPLSSRVAGAGDVFLAGAEVPGEFVEGKHVSESQDGVVAGL